MKELDSVYVAEIWYNTELVKLKVFSDEISAFDWANNEAKSDESISVEKHKINRGDYK